jgi:hypothetical protein
MKEFWVISILGEFYFLGKFVVYSFDLMLKFLIIQIGFARIVNFAVPAVRHQVIGGLHLEEIRKCVNIAEGFGGYGPLLPVLAVVYNELLVLLD